MVVGDYKTIIKIVQIISYYSCHGLRALRNRAF